MPDEPKANAEQKSKSAQTWLMIGAGLAMLYVLSVGPAWRITEACGGNFRWLDTAYAPIIAVMEQSPQLFKVFQWYVFDLWQCPLPPPPK